MDLDWIKSNWAIWAATVPGALVLRALFLALWRRSGRGKLAARSREHRRTLRELRRVRRSAEKLENRVRSLAQKADRVTPRNLQEARDRLADQRALVKIHDDKSQVSANRLRQVIYEEFPPARHEKLRRKYLPQDVADGRPFSF